MKVTALVVTLLSLFAVASPALAADPSSELFATIAWQDARNSHDRTVIAEGSFVFPVLKHLSIGPALRYSYVRTEGGDESSFVYTPPVLPDGLTTAPPPAPTPTSTVSSESIWSVGPRVVLFAKESHNGFYGGAQAMFPDGRAEGWLAIPFVGAQWSWGRAIGHVEYQRPYQYSGDAGAIDLEEDVFLLGLGAKF